MYDNILQELVSRNLDDVDDIRRILQWLVGSIVPLTLEELAEAVSIRIEDRNLDHSGIATDLMDLAACCGALVTIRTQGTNGDVEDLRGPSVTLISLSRASVEEYLISGKMARGLSDIFHMDDETVHHEIAMTCLQYIGFNDFENPIKSLVSVHFRSRLFREKY
jgi:hypothetical protein